MLHGICSRAASWGVMSPAAVPMLNPSEVPRLAKQLIAGSNAAALLTTDKTEDSRNPRSRDSAFQMLTRLEAVQDHGAPVCLWRLATWGTAALAALSPALPAWAPPGCAFGATVTGG